MHLVMQIFLSKIRIRTTIGTALSIAIGDVFLLLDSSALNTTLKSLEILQAITVLL